MHQSGVNAFILVLLCTIMFSPQCIEAGFIKDLPETLEGHPNEFSNRFPLPMPVVTGFLVIMETGNPQNKDDQTNKAKWSDIVEFLKDNDNNYFAEVTSDLSETGGGIVVNQDFLNRVIAAQKNNSYISEAQTGDTVYKAGANTYNVKSNQEDDLEFTPIKEPSIPESPAGAPVPEGGTFLLCAVSFPVLYFVRLLQALVRMRPVPHS